MSRNVIMTVCFLLALVAALAYALMGMGYLLPGDLAEREDLLPVYYFIGTGGYVLGGVLIFLRKRWLWIIGAVINGLGVTGFYIAYYARPEIMASTTGLMTKIAQIIMEIGLIYLIITYKRREKQQSS